mgnify:CR=1 FL=1
MNDSHIAALLKAYAHDIKGSLGANAAFARLILEEYGSKLDEKGAKWLSLMANEYALTDIKLSRLSHYSQLYKYQVRTEDCHLGTIIGTVIGSIIGNNPSDKMQVQANNVAINYPRKPIIKSDSNLLHMYFSELIANTQQHAAHQSKHNSETKVHIRYNNADKVHQLVYIEHDTMLSDDEIAYIQLPLKTLDTAHSKLNNAGMGFTILQRIAELLSGNLKVELINNGDDNLQAHSQGHSDSSLVVTLEFPQE